MGGSPSKPCTIWINNMSNVYSLIKPQVFRSSGNCYDPPQPTISSNRTEVCKFTRTQGIVLTYDLFHMENQEYTKRMAILFSVPDHYNLIMGVGLFETTRKCDQTLYQCMSKERDSSWERETRENAEVFGIIYRAQMVELRATMSNAGEAIIKVEIHDI